MQFSREIVNYFPLLGSFAAIALGVSGCNSDNKLRVYPVKGNVVFKQADVQGLAEGYVELRSIDDPKIIAMGEIKPDGSFELGSQVAGQDYAGAPEGDYQARIVLPANSGGQPRPQRPTLAPRYLSFDASGLKYTVKPGRNNFSVELETARR